MNTDRCTNQVVGGGSRKRGPSVAREMLHDWAIFVALRPSDDAASLVLNFRRDEASFLPKSAVLRAGEFEANIAWA